MNKRADMMRPQFALDNESDMGLQLPSLPDKSICKS